MKRVYGDSMSAPRGASWEPWVDPDRIDGEIAALLPRDPQQAERWFLNRKQASEGAAFDLDRWKALADPRIVIADKALVVIGVDGARWDDALGMVATDVEQAHQWPLGIWEVPQSAPDDYEHPLHEVDGAMIDAFERFEIERVYVDPQYIETLFERWQGRWGDKKIQAWWMHRPKPAAFATRNYRAAQMASDLSHDGDSVMARHIANARRKKVNVKDEDNRQLFVISKDRPMSPRKIDGAAAGLLSWEARGDAIAAGALETYRSVYEDKELTIL